jgi:hypothetical protein
MIPKDSRWDSLTKKQSLRVINVSKKLKNYSKGRGEEISLTSLASSTHISLIILA